MHCKDTKFFAVLQAFRPKSSAFNAKKLKIDAALVAALLLAEEYERGREVGVRGMIGGCLANNHLLCCPVYNGFL